MTRDELIEAMAAIACGQETYDRIGESDRDWYREEMRDFLPLIVEFVAGWLGSKDVVLGSRLSDQLVGLWREGMEAE